MPLGKGRLLQGAFRAVEEGRNQQSRFVERRGNNPGPSPEKQDLSPLERIVSPGSATRRGASGGAAPIAGVGNNKATRPSLTPINQSVDPGAVMRRGALEQQRQRQDRQRSSIDV